MLNFSSLHSSPFDLYIFIPIGKWKVSIPFLFMSIVHWHHHYGNSLVETTNLVFTHLNRRSFFPTTLVQIICVQIQAPSYRLQFRSWSYNKNELQVSHVPSSHQIADLLTKPLSQVRHQFLTKKIGVVDPSSILRGRIDSALP